MEGIADRKRNIKLTLEYDGSLYHGWQFQDNAVSVQEILSKAIKALTGEDVMPTGAGRTDAGVHACGQVANFRTESPIPAERFTPALNSLLPPGIAVLRSEEAEEGFHARFSAKGKHYRYLILNRPQRSPIWENRAWHVRGNLDLETMRQALSFLPGKHDFKAFCASGHQNVGFVRTITSLEVVREGDILRVDIRGDGFLYNMVRIIVGTMVDIGRGYLAPGVIPEALRTGDRNTLGMTAPAVGLYLMEVFY
jgi:tRNA pseudouridine38-40 synthase